MIKRCPILGWGVIIVLAAGCGSGLTIPETEESITLLVTATETSIASSNDSSIASPAPTTAIVVSTHTPTPTITPSPISSPTAIVQETTTTRLQDAINRAENGTLVIVEEGLYQESVVIDKPLTLLSFNGAKTIIEPPEGQPAFRVTASGVTIWHLTIRGSTRYGIEFFGALLTKPKYLSIRKILFENNHLGGVLLENMAPGTLTGYIENNTFIGGQYGIRLNVLEQPEEKSVLRNNIFFGQSIAPIKIDSATDGGVEYSYNLFNTCAQTNDENCSEKWYEGTLDQSSNIHDNLLNINPMFNDPLTGDYTLLPNSPAIDAGDPMTLNERGLDGRIPQRTDIGAFEMELVLDVP